MSKSKEDAIPSVRIILFGNPGDNEYRDDSLLSKLTNGNRIDQYNIYARSGVPSSVDGIRCMAD